MRRSAAAIYALAAVLGTPQSSIAQSDFDHDEIVLGGPWHARSVPCTDARVTYVGPRLDPGHGPPFKPEEYAQTGVAVGFEVPRGFRFMPKGVIPTVGVVHYQEEHDNKLMISQFVGERVQVCLMSFPVPRYSTDLKRTICDPDADPRGWIFRVYVYDKRAAYFGGNSQHSCGGA